MGKYLKISAFLIPISVVTIFGFNNCARYGQLSNSETTTSGSTDLGSNAPVDEVNSEKLGLPYALLSAEQTLSSMMKLTNVTTPSAALLTEYNGRYGSLAAGNDLSMANGPLMLGSTSLAGEVCNTMLTSEKAAADTARNFYGGVNFTTGVSSVTDAQFNTSVRSMARQFWGRSESAEELTMMQTYKTEFINALAANLRTQAASTSNLMLASCAAMLSSVDAISY
jgi:hypothetical protein